MCYNIVQYILLYAAESHDQHGRMRAELRDPRHPRVEEEDKNIQQVTHQLPSGLKLHTHIISSEPEPGVLPKRLSHLQNP